MIYLIVILPTILIIAIYIYFEGTRKIESRTEVSEGETNEIYTYLKNELKIETYKGIGIFYASPKKARKEAKATGRLLTVYCA